MKKKINKDIKLAKKAMREKNEISLEELKARLNAKQDRYSKVHV